jgi:23S rRNA (adenine2503-C2)-methyltransferase
MDKIDIKSMKLDDLRELVISLGGRSYNRDQIYKWLHQKNVSTFEKMTDLSKDFRTQLNDKCYISTVKIEKKQVSEDGTVKYLYRLYDDNFIETVLMHYEYGNSLCVSSQVGCRMGCKFCASTKHGKVRNLSAGEILRQVYTTRRDENIRIDNVVLMGIGEPLDNFENVVDFIKIISSKEGKNLSLRNISLSTCGIVPKIYDLAEENLPITLSISLHATTDEKRKKIMPVANAYSIKEIIKACRRYSEKTGRRISFEYSMINGFNDSRADAMALGKLLKGINSHVNLIPINPIAGSTYRPGSEGTIRNFQNKLLSIGVNATVRRTLGQDISAACGQLRNENL